MMIGCLLLLPRNQSGLAVPAAQCQVLTWRCLEEHSGTLWDSRCGTQAKHYQPPKRLSPNQAYR